MVTSFRSKTSRSAPDFACSVLWFQPRCTGVLFVGIRNGHTDPLECKIRHNWNVMIPQCNKQLTLHLFIYLFILQMFVSRHVPQKKEIQG